jgi:hypothetical protein
MVGVEWFHLLVPADTNRLTPPLVQQAAVGGTNSLNQIHTLTAQLLSDAPAQSAASASPPPSTTSTGKASTAVKAPTSPSSIQSLNALSSTPLQSGSIPCVK